MRHATRPPAGVRRIAPARLVVLVVAAVASLAVVTPPVASAVDGVTARAYVVLSDEEGAGTLEAVCTGQADSTPGIIATRVSCWTSHTSAELSVPGPLAVTRLRATEGGRQFNVCVSAEAYYDNGSLVVDGPRCFLPDLIVARDGDGCRAFADPPYSSHNFSLDGRGGFACNPGRSVISATVCIEVLDASGWMPIACSDSEQRPGTFVETKAYGCRYGAWLTRTVAMGTAAGAGASDRAESAPVAYYCTPLSRA